MTSPFASLARPQGQPAGSSVVAHDEILDLDLQSLPQPRQRRHAARLPARLDFGKIPGAHACRCGKFPLRASALFPPDLDGALPLQQATCFSGSKVIAAGSLHALRRLMPAPLDHSRAVERVFQRNPALLEFMTWRYNIL